MKDVLWMCLLCIYLGVVMGEQERETIPQVMADQGNWTVEDCILVRIASEISIQPDPENKNKTVKMVLPVDAVATGTCGTSDKNQTVNPKITLNWSEPSPEDGSKPRVQLRRNITIEFAKNETVEMYGVQKISAVYETKQYVINSTIPDPDDPDNKTIAANVTVTEFVLMTTFKMDHLVYVVPLNRSYLCTDAGNQEMHTELHKSNEQSTDSGIKLPNAVLSATKVQLDAFRTVPYEDFQTPMDCTYRPNDVVPIIVGCALASLVLMVLVAYLFGRRKSRARGYQSV